MSVLSKTMYFRMRKILLGVGALIIMAIFAVGLLIIFEKKKPVENVDISKPSISDMIGSFASSLKTDKPEISGWIAWWEEEDGFRVAEANSQKLSEISPGWLKLDKNQALVEVGKIDKPAETQKIKASGIKFYPMLSCELSDKELAAFIAGPNNVDNFSKDLINKLKDYQADGVDIDIENIDEHYSSDFSLLIKSLREALQKDNLKLSVTVQAQTGQNDWTGLKGQDLGQIAQNADEVRLMIYDKHGQFSNSGPITPMDWYKNVIDYSLKFIPRTKFVIGLPTYGYVWSKGGTFNSYQYKDFIKYTRDNQIEMNRDSDSFELEFSNDNATGWLSDSESVIKKMDYARSLGLNRFIIWNLGGTDESIFNHKW
jgi:spore germination protein